MRLFGLIGYPLSHSFSLTYFNEKFRREGLKDCRFDNYPISSIESFNDLIVSKGNDLKGLAVTIPYKQSVLKYINEKKHIPDGVSACNCIKIAGTKLIGYNTDIIGFENSLVPLLKSFHNKALILGNGGATSAVAFVLKRLEIEFKIVSRKEQRGSDLTYGDITEEMINEYLLIINTTPLGMYPDTSSYPNIPYTVISKNHLLYDLIYNPEKTLFLQKGEKNGARIKNGMEMLVIQAEENWKIWNS